MHGGCRVTSGLVATRGPIEAERLMETVSHKVTLTDLKRDVGQAEHADAQHQPCGAVCAPRSLKALFVTAVCGLF